jgi:excisionase family DNA binding protein
MSRAAVKEMGTKDAASHLGISKARLTQLVREKRIAGVRTVGNGFIFTLPIKIDPPTRAGK